MKMIKILQKKYINVGGKDLGDRVGIYMYNSSLQVNVPSEGI